jgi:ATP-dependent RNA helicase DeaD
MKDTFEELGLGPELLAELAVLGYEEPTPIQKAAIPPVLEGKDLLGQAATGTGKTAAFALPILQKIGKMKPEALKPLALVLVPTRELAVQVSEAFHKYGKGLHASVVPIYGGQEFHRQIVGLKRGAHVVVATPGRALDHLRRETLDLSALQLVVLDEADEMLDMGFAEDLELILEAAPETRQTALFSATLPPRIASIAERHLKDPARILIPRDTGTKGSVPKVRQTAYIVPRGHKIAALGRVLDLESPTLALVFCRTRLEVDELADRLVGRGYRVEALHGGMSQTERDRVMKKARAGTVDLLVATDVAARGIDIDHLTHVVNFNVPASPESYVHRIGRTGRAGREGVAITIAEPREHRLLRNIEQTTRQKIAISTVPTPLDVKARRLDLTKGAVRDVLLAGELEGYRVVVETLAAEFDLMDVAAAAVRMAHELTAGEAAQEDDVHIPVIESFARPNAGPRPGYGGGGNYGGGGGGYGGGQQGFAPRGAAPRNFGPRAEGPNESGAPARKPGGWNKGPAGEGGPRGGNERNAQDMVRIYIAAGTKMGMRPADLVGAIANEANVNPRGIGDIEIAETFSIVELPERDVDHVIRALRGATLRGRKVKVNRDLGFRNNAPRPQQ